MRIERRKYSRDLLNFLSAAMGRIYTSNLDAVSKKKEAKLYRMRMEQSR